MWEIGQSIPKRVLYRIPIDYNDHWGGEETPPYEAYQKLDLEIAKRLPEDIVWCGDELIAFADSKWFADDSTNFAELFDRILEQAYCTIFEEGYD